MAGNTELLEFVHKNAEMGVSTIPKVKEMVEVPEMLDALDHQLKEYQEIARQAESAIRRRGGEPKGPGEVSDTMSDIMLHMKTAVDKSPSHIAEMMIRGSTMGTVQATRRIHQYADQKDREALDLADRLLETEERNIQQLKAYL